MPRSDRPRVIKNSDLFNNFEGGLAEDSKDRIEIPFWKILKNLRIRDKNEVHGRPHAHRYLGLSSGIGIASSHENTPIVLANGAVYVNGALKGSYTGSGPVSSDFSLGKTVITAGGAPFFWDGTTITALIHTNVKCLALAYGASKSRFFFVKNDDLRTLWFTTRGNWNDIGTIITDDLGNTDLKTEGGRYKGWASDIIDIMEFLGDLVVFTKKGVFRLDFTSKEGLMYPIKRKVADIDIWDVKPIRFSTGIYFLNKRGPQVYSIGETGPFVTPIPLEKNERAIQGELKESEASIGVDEARGLMLLKTSNTTDIWVLHVLEKGIYARWDLDFNDSKTIDGITYLTSSSGSFELKDQGDGQNFYDIIIRSGLNAFGSPILVKRMDTIGVLCHFSEKGSYFIGFLPDCLMDVNFVPTKFPKEYSGPRNIGRLIRLDESVKHPFEVGALHLIFRNYDEFILHDLYAVWISKDSRREDSA